MPYHILASHTPKQPLFQGGGNRKYEILVENNSSLKNEFKFSDHFLAYKIFVYADAGIINYLNNIIMFQKKKQNSLTFKKNFSTDYIKIGKVRKN